MWQIITIICVTNVQQGFSIWTLIKQLLTKYQLFTKLPKILYIYKNRNFVSIIEKRYNNCFYSIKILGQGHVGNLLFHFFSCEPLTIFAVFLQQTRVPIKALPLPQNVKVQSEADQGNDFIFSKSLCANCFLNCWIMQCHQICCGRTR